MSHTGTCEAEAPEHEHTGPVTVSRPPAGAGRWSLGAGGGRPGGRPSAARRGWGLVASGEVRWAAWSVLLLVVAAEGG
ncbi:MAG: hypothetical protein ACR2G7_13410, partial [Acidimicrobiales bacterium]